MKQNSTIKDTSAHRGTQKTTGALFVPVKIHFILHKIKILQLKWGLRIVKITKRCLTRPQHHSYTVYIWNTHIHRNTLSLKITPSGLSLSGFVSMEMTIWPAFGCCPFFTVSSLFYVCLKEKLRSLRDSACPGPLSTLTNETSIQMFLWKWNLSAHTSQGASHLADQPNSNSIRVDIAFYYSPVQSSGSFICTFKLFTLSFVNSAAWLEAWDGL